MKFKNFQGWFCQILTRKYPWSIYQTGHGWPPEGASVRWAEERRDALGNGLVLVLVLVGVSGWAGPTQTESERSLLPTAQQQYGQLGFGELPFFCFFLKIFGLNFCKTNRTASVGGSDGKTRAGRVAGASLPPRWRLYGGPQSPCWSSSRRAPRSGRWGPSCSWRGPTPGTGRPGTRTGAGRGSSRRTATRVYKTLQSKQKRIIFVINQ